MTSSSEAGVPEISVVVPCYRGGELLCEGIDSIFAQTFKNYEIVLVDNNADSTTKSVMERYRSLFPDKIRIVSEPEQGVCSARNRGILESRGEFVALLDDDDLMKPERLQRQLSAARKNPKASMVISGVDYIDGQTRQTLEANVLGQRGIWKTMENLFRELLKAHLPERETETFFISIPSTMLFGRDRAISVGMFDRRFNPNFGEDLEFALRMFMAGDFCLQKESLALYRTDAPASLSNRRSAGRVRFLYIQGNKLHYILWERFGSGRPDLLPLFRKMAAFHLRLAGLHFLRYKNGTGSGRSLLFRALRYVPSDRDARRNFLKSLFPKSLHPHLFWFSAHHPDLLPKEANRDFFDRLFVIPPVWIDEGGAN